MRAAMANIFFYIGFSIRDVLESCCLPCELGDGIRYGTPASLHGATVKIVPCRRRSHVVTIAPLRSNETVYTHVILQCIHV